MSDLVERLRYLANLDCTEENFGSIPPTYLSDAADRIEALEAALREIADGSWLGSGAMKIKARAALAPEQDK